MRFKNMYDPEGRWFVRQDGSGGVYGNGDCPTAHQTMGPLVPDHVRWRDWLKGERTMEVADQGAVKLVRREIAERWTNLMNCYVENGS
jgi:hypothetical protein